MDRQNLLRGSHAEICCGVPGFTDVLLVFKGYVSARLRVEYEYFKMMHDVEKFQRIWCIGEAVFAVKEGEKYGWVELCSSRL